VIENQVAQRAGARQRVVGSELLARLVYYRSTRARGYWVSLVRSARLRAWEVAPDDVNVAVFHDHYRVSRMAEDVRCRVERR
jgi:hypothetical protein